jgi:hypothetical protein
VVAEDGGERRGVVAEERGLVAEDRGREPRGEPRGHALMADASACVMCLLYLYRILGERDCPASSRGCYHSTESANVNRQTWQSVCLPACSPIDAAMQKRKH